ncbi:MAG TPA: CPBP family intramembrane metalloprotease, partial [Sphingobacterium sp.]|nr:CPBP family intramembrane metalloprotease [Sphingobacterium sp.]
RMLNNHHLAIWITAVVFSAIHFQFYGFFPRLLLGAFFGYMMAWTQNIWVPVVAHFINNASVTLLAFYFTKQGKTYADLQTYESYSIFVYIGGVALSLATGYWFYRYTSNRKKIYGTRLD